MHQTFNAREQKKFFKCHFSHYSKNASHKKPERFDLSKLPYRTNSSTTIQTYSNPRSLQQLSWWFCNTWYFCFPKTNASIAQKMKFSIKDFFRKCDQIRRFLWICSHLLKKSLMENFIFRAVFHLHKHTDQIISNHHNQKLKPE